MQLVGETSAPLRHFVFLAVGVERQADDQFCRLPLADEFPDFGKTPVIGFGMDDGQGTGGFRQIVADGAKSKPSMIAEPVFMTVWYLLCRRQAVKKDQACPTPLASRDGSNPRRRMAAAYRSWMGKSKMMAGSAGAVSQPLWLISLSSWPALHPA